MTDDKFPTIPYGELPPLLRVLEISARGETSESDSHNWLAECLANDSAMDIKLEPATLTSAMTLLRQEVFDVVIVHHLPGHVDAMAAIGPIRTSSPDCLAVVVVGDESASSMSALCLEATADAYFCRGETDVRTLLWGLARASERQRLLRECRSLQESVAQQKSRQHQEAIHQLRAQRSLLVEHFVATEQHDPHPPAWLTECFLELLRIYVVTGTGNLRDEVTQLAGRLELCEVTLAEALTAHTLAAEEMVLGLGNRPAWHILGRANLLAYELVMQMTGHHLNATSECD